MQDRSPPARRIHLQRTAGPYIGVKLRRTHCEQMSSGLPLKADIARCSRHVAFVPTTVIPQTHRLRDARMQLYRARKSRVTSAFTTGYAAITARSVTRVPSAGIVLEEAVLFVGQTIISETPVH
jgi:hypothetical protein